MKHGFVGPELEMKNRKGFFNTLPRICVRRRCRRRRREGEEKEEKDRKDGSQQRGRGRVLAGIR